MWQKFSGPSFTGWSNIDDAIRNCTRLNFGQKSRNVRCKAVLECVLDATNVSQQANFSAAGTILGLLPTALSMMATSIDDLIRIHCRFPLLAFLLSLTNPSTISPTLESHPIENRTFLCKRSPGLLKLLSKGFYIPLLKRHVPIPLWLHDLSLHALAAGCVTIVIYYTLILGRGGVIVFACWTWHNPITWVSVGGMVHLLRVVFWRLCLGEKTPSSGRKLACWHWSISQNSDNLTIAYPRLQRLFALCFQVIGLMNYGYGTVIMSGMTLVNPEDALKLFTFVGISGLVGRVIALWLLDIYPDIPVDELANK